MNQLVEKYGRTMSQFSMVLMSIAVLIFDAGVGILSSTSKIITVVVILAALVVMGICKKRGYQEKLYVLTYGLATTYLALHVSLVTGKYFLLLVVFLLQWPVVLFYQSRISCGLIACTEIAALITYYASSSRVEGDISLGLLFLGIVVISISVWFYMILIGSLKSKEENLRQQDISREDILNVVEAMCDDARGATNAHSQFLFQLSSIIRRPARKLAGQGEAAADELIRVADSLQDYFSLVSGKLTLKAEEFGMDTLIHDVLRRHKASMIKKGIHFEILINPEMDNRFVGDEIRLAQILDTLLDNAIRYTRRGTVSIKMETEKSVGRNYNLYVEVADTGNGIRKADQLRVFEPFCHVGEKAVEQQAGLGLGLYLARAYAEMMGGSLGLISEYGSGSTFRLCVLLGWGEKDNNQKLYPLIQNSLLMESEADADREEEGKAQEEAVCSPKEGGLPFVEGVSWQEAKKYLPTDEILFITIKQLLAQSADNQKELREYYNEYIGTKNPDLLGQYRIRVHAMKGSLKTIGAIPLSEKAKTLEYAARDGAADVLLQGTDPFLKEYSALMMQLAKVVGVSLLDESEEGLPDYVPEDIRQLVDDIIVDMEEFDTDSADQKAASLKNFRYPSEMREVIEQLIRHVTMLDVEGIKKEKERLQIWLKKS